jgi:hypothetical protein
MSLTWEDVKRLPKPFRDKWYFRKVHRWHDAGKLCDVCIADDSNMIKYGWTPNKAVTLSLFTLSRRKIDWTENGRVDLGEYVWVRMGDAVCNDHTPEEQKAMSAAIYERAKYHNEWFDLEHWYWRWFYTAKAIACILLGRDEEYVDCKNKCDNCHGYHFNRIVGQIAHWDVSSHSHPDAPMGACGWTELSVGRGVFKNWFYEIGSDQSY